MYLIAGLGNPGLQYVNTRHNVGFDAALCLHDREKFSLERVKFNAMVSKGKIGEEDVVLVRPLTYMNLSGNAIRQVMDFYKIDPSCVIVIYDDIDLPLGKLRIRGFGSAGSHNGMKSVVQQLGTQDFPRIRIGVGAKPEGWDLADWVLSHFSKEDRTVIDETVKSAVDSACAIITKGLDKAMNLYNVK